LPSLDGVPAERLAARLRHDKKTTRGKTSFVLPERIGRVRITADVDPARVRAAIEERCIGNARTTPEGARTEEQAATWVRGMFGRIAPRYDLLNHLLSFNIDRWWRTRTVKRVAHVLDRPDARVLDLCCGTGDLMLALEARRESPCSGAISRIRCCWRRGARSLRSVADPWCSNPMRCISHWPTVRSIW